MQVFQALLALLIFASIPVYIENLPINLWSIGVFRLFCAVSLGFVFLKNKKQFLISWKNHSLIYLSLGSFFFIHWLSYFYAIKQTSGSYGVLGLCTYGFQLSLLGRLFLGEKWKKTHYLSLVLILLALLLLYPIHMGPAFFVGILSGFFYACIPLMHKKWDYIPHSFRTQGQFSIALICFLATFSQFDFSLLSLNGWLKLSYLGIFGTFIAHGIWIRLSTVWPAHHTGTLYYSIIPLTLLLNSFINQEIHSLQKWIGACLIIVANLLLFTKRN